MKLNLGHIDMRQLHCLKVLVQERSVSKAALRLGASQPSLSSVLAKLRQTFEDPLLIRTSGGMAPTPCARKLVEHYDRIIEGFGTIVANYATFDSKTSTRQFRIQASDHLIETIISRLIALLRKEAPNLSIAVDYISDKNFREHLESGEVDLIVGYLPIADNTLLRSTLTTTKVCCIASKSHPSIEGKLDLDTYVRVPHLGLSLGKGNFASFTDGSIDEVLLKMGHNRIKTMQVPSVLAMPNIVAQTDLVATVPAYVAERAVRELPVQSFPVPLPNFRLTYSMVWHLRNDKDPAHIWLRRAVGTVSRSKAES